MELTRVGLFGYLYGAFIRFRTRNGDYENKPERHPALADIQKNELVPFKGTHWRVADVRELPIPCIILVPVSATRASKIRALSEMRRADRILTKDETTVRRSLEKRAREA